MDRPRNRHRPRSPDGRRGHVRRSRDRRSPRPRSPRRQPNRRRRRLSSSSLSSTDSEYLKTASWIVGRSRTRSPHPWLRRLAGSIQLRRGSERDNDRQVIWDGFQWVTKSNIVSANIDEVLEANRRARLLCISNVPSEYNITEFDLKMFLNKKMLEYNLTEASAEKSVLRIWIDEENNNIYVAEFNSQDEATKGLKLDGINLLGRSLKVGRMEEVEGLEQRGLSLGINTQAMSALDNVKASATAAATAVAAIQDLQSGINRDIAADYEFEHPLSRVLKVYGFMHYRDCKNLPNSEFYDIERDMKEEFSQYGTVEYCHMVRPYEAKIGAEAGSVFIVFNTPEVAQNATHRMSGKKFDKKAIKIVEIPERVFEEELKVNSDRHK